MFPSLGKEVEAALEERRSLGKYTQCVPDGRSNLRGFEVKRLELALDPAIQLLEGEVDSFGRLLHDLQSECLILKAQQKLAVLRNLLRFGQDAEEILVHQFGCES